MQAFANLNNKSFGFTLIELAIVIAIIGILAAVALPQYIDMTGNARSAAVQGVAGALASGNAVNYAARKVNSSNGVAISNCTDASKTLAGATLPASYTITSAAVGATASATCTLTFGSSTATFIVYGIS